METKYKIKGLFAKIRDDLQTEITPCLNRGNRGGYFSVTLIVFSLIEYLGTLYKNPIEKDEKNKRRTYYTKTQIQKTAIPYIQKYLGRVRQEYKIYSGLLYALYRHSLVHYFHPTEILFDNKKITWKIIKGSKKDHLLCTKQKTNYSKVKFTEQITLAINIDILIQDLFSSLDEFEKDALKFKKISTNIIRADKKLNNPRPAFSFTQKYIIHDLENL